MRLPRPIPADYGARTMPAAYASAKYVARPLSDVLSNLSTPYDDVELLNSITTLVHELYTART